MVENAASWCSRPTCTYISGSPPGLPHIPTVARTHTLRDCVGEQMRPGVAQWLVWQTINRCVLSPPHTAILLPMAVQRQRPVQMSSSKGCAHVDVHVTQGRLRGRKALSKLGDVYYSFQGIPYAQPPIGILRFQAPRPAEPWRGIRDALTEGPMCPHKGWMVRKYRGQEDSLMLNVYTPELPGSSPAPLLPVMVWIHGGGFAIGSGNTDLYGPDYLVAAGVVVVTFNYRLGVLGFLSLEDSWVPGNAGLKDQVAALKWVHQNIDKFGGNPNNVTLFGESAGGASVHYHMLSTMSKGLFHRAICQSGSVLNPWAKARTRSLRMRAFRLGEALGCRAAHSEELVACLRSVTARQLVEASAAMVTAEECRRRTTLPYLPIQEEQAGDEEEVFLTAEPLDLLKAGMFHQVPLIMGMTSHEGILDLEDILKNPSILETINEDFERCVPEDLTAKEEEIAKKMRRFYFGDRAVNMDTIMGYVHMNTDWKFAYGIDKAVKIHADISSSPVYYYQFCFDGALGLAKKFINAASIPGACHIDDVGYLFRSHLMDVDVAVSSPEMKTLRRMVKLWTNFAKTGNPTPELDPDINIIWKPYTNSNPVHLKIDKELRLEQGLLKDRISFWNELYSEQPCMKSMK